MKYHAELIYLIKEMLRLRKTVTGYESPITLDFEGLNQRVIPNIDFLKNLLSELTRERVPVEGESSRKKVIGHIKNLGDGKITVHESSTEKLQNFLKQMGVTAEKKKVKILPTIEPPLPHIMTWERMRMVVNERHEVYVFYRDEDDREGTKHKVDSAQLGMLGRKKNTPSRLWWQLQKIAQNRGIYTYHRTNQDMGRQDKVALTNLLKQRFELAEDPFEPMAHMEYKTKFQIEYRAEFPLPPTRGSSGSLEEFSEEEE